MRFIAALSLSDPAHYLDVARTADACGIDAVALSDHVVVPVTLSSPYPYSENGRPPFDLDTPWPDPWVAIGAMAAVTTRLRFMTNVYVLPARHPFVVAKAVGTAAVLSDNRVELGIGIGWMREEFELMGQRFEDRGRRTDEAVAVIRALWQGGPVTFDGTFYRFDALTMVPAPTRPVPIYVGGESGPALRRAARLGDGWISTLRTREELIDFMGRLRALRTEYGRAHLPFDFVVSCSEAFDADAYRRLEDIGVTSILTIPWILYGGDPTVLATKREGLERFAEDVVRKLR
jgi:probable F420-dependent oxidoreductase